MYLFVKYNKPHNQSIDNLTKNIQYKVIDLQDISKSIDNISCESISKYFNSLSYIKAITHIIIGDIFWPTGQNICKFGSLHDKKIVFLQHGQWIYVENKKNPPYLPYVTFLYGDHLLQKVKGWPYGLKSKCFATGSPKYDNINIKQGDYFYFCPPVILETFPSRSSVVNTKNQLLLHSLKGLDSYCKLSVHPHYREGDIQFIKELFPKAEFFDTELNSLDLIKNSKGVITHRDSTTVIDAISCKKKSLLLNFNNEKQSYFKKFYFRDYCVENDNFGQLINNIDNIDFIKEHYSYVDDYIQQGNSSEKIFRIMED